MDISMRGVLAGFALLTLGTVAAGPAAAAGSSPDFAAFESGHVRPMAMSPDGTRLFVVNTPDNRLEVFAVRSKRLAHMYSIPVGMEPVAVAARSNEEVWVVNHLSDSVSVVSLNPLPRVARTLKVGDEPSDIVFAGPGKARAFITAANREHVRKQRVPGQQDGGADVYVFDADDLGTSIYGDPITVVNLFSDVPRGLAVSPDGNTVYAASHYSGNQTTVVSGAIVLNDGLPPFENVDGIPAPRHGLIVKWDGSAWRDTAGRDWTAEVPIRLPDYDLFAIDAAAQTPGEIGRIPHVGTTLFNIAVNPVSGKLYVSNFESLNLTRFEGPGEYAGSTVRGRMVDNRITVIDGANVMPRDLNKHIDYSAFNGTSEENAKSLAMPLEMAVSSDGSTLYVAAFSSSKIGVFSTAELENDSFVPDSADHIEVGGGGPSGVMLDETNNVLYVTKRFSNSVGVINLATGQEMQEIAMHNPEPADLVAGRPFLYDARFGSSRGNGSCASCHIFGDTDQLGWDLGDPDAGMVHNPNPLRLDLLPQITELDFHPMKGVMFTQSLRGMDNHGPLHWRGDRSGGNEPIQDPFDEHASFKTFRGAFEGLVGKAEPIPEPNMEEFADFALQLTYPPNPLRRIDNQQSEMAARGEDFYRNFLTARFPSLRQNFTCNDCHVVDGVQGFFGTDGMSAARPGRFGGGDVVKIPHVRSVYTKMGNYEDVNNTDPATGEQFRGYFINHEGSTTTLMNFLFSGEFVFPGENPQRREVAEFLLTVDSNLAPIVGQQVTVTSANKGTAWQVVRVMETRAAVTEPREECDLIAQGFKGTERRSWLRLANGLYQSDRAGESPVFRGTLFGYVTGPTQEMTFTCVPPGSGVRAALDRDRDGAYDRDELDAGTDPEDPTSTPGA